MKKLDKDAQIDELRPIYTEAYTKLDQLLPCIVTAWNVRFICKNLHYESDKLTLYSNTLECP